MSGQVFEQSKADVLARCLSQQMARRSFGPIRLRGGTALDAGQLIDLLAAAAAKARPAARRLIQQLQAQPWRLGAGSKPDASELVVQLAFRTYVVRVESTPSLRVTDIVG